jgi:hypothetical protein
MEAAEILSTARSSSAPSNWVILPLRRNQVRLAILGWALGAIMGLGLFAAIFAAAWPDNFESGAGALIITCFFLAILAFAGIGSAWLLTKDTLRLLHADESMIVLTPEVYCKQEGKKVDLVPLEEIGYITTRGSRPPDKRSSWASYSSNQPTHDPQDRQIGGALPTGQAFLGFRRKPRGPTSVAFVDLRTDKKIMVTNDQSYAHPYELGETLHSYVETRLMKMEEEARKR